MKSIPPFFIIFLLALLFLLPASVSAENEPSKVFECSFIHWDDNPKEALFYRMDDEYHPIVFRRGARGGKVSLRRIAEFELYRQLANPAQGQPPYELVASALIPEHFEKVVFFVIGPDEKKGTGYRLVVVDDSSDFFPRKHFLFVNLTEKKITVDFASESEEIAAGDMCAMPSNVDKSGSFVPCVMRGEDGEMIYGTRLFGSHSAREHVFIMPAIQDGVDRPRLKFISEMVATPATELSP